jgi:hypothetical protein
MSVKISGCSVLKIAILLLSSNAKEYKQVAYMRSIFIAMYHSKLQTGSQDRCPCIHRTRV